MNPILRKKPFFSPNKETNLPLDHRIKLSALDSLCSVEAPSAFMWANILIMKELFKPQLLWCLARLLQKLNEI